MLAIDIQRETTSPSPSDELLQRAALQALSVIGKADAAYELSLRIVDREEMQSINANFRDKDKPTNVLSFPAELPSDVDLPLLGDIVVCAPVVEAEARAQGKPAAAHWDHMIIHGLLHLMGYDHEIEEQALTMEALEERALAELGWPSPYDEEHRENLQDSEIPA
ncbi:MAG: rRNA maturation RNase YbeY [Congregibacter sp.]